MAFHQRSAWHRDPTELEKLDGLTSDAKQRKWLNGERMKTRVNPLLGPAERFQRSWRYLSFEDQQRFVREEALPFLIAQARLDGLTEIALLTPPSSSCRPRKPPDPYKSQLYWS